MKFILAICVALLVIVSLTDAAISHSGPSKNPAHPDKCWDESTKTAYAKGENYPENSCSSVYCADDYSYTISSCGVVGVEDGWELKSDPTKQYPNCCPKPVKKE